MADVEGIMTKFHEELLKKICRLTKSIDGLEKEVFYNAKNKKSEMIHQHSSTSLRPTISKNMKSTSR